MYCQNQSFLCIAFNAVFPLKFCPFLTKDFHCLKSDNLRIQNPSFEGVFRDGKGANQPGNSGFFCPYPNFAPYHKKTGFPA